MPSTDITFSALTTLNITVTAYSGALCKIIAKNKTKCTAVKN